MTEILFRTTAGAVKPGEQIRFRNSKAWWEVVSTAQQGYILISRGKKRRWLSPGWELYKRDPQAEKTLGLR